MTTQHTQGIWHAVKREVRDYAGNKVAEASTARHLVSGTPEANAILIAAAPDLLNALVGLLSHVEELAFIQGYSKREIQEGKAFQPARAAIAKATGGQS